MGFFMNNSWGNVAANAGGGMGYDKKLTIAIIQSCSATR